MISDAGTPSLSDPGRILINRCVEENIPIIPIPGASAITTAISISGFSDKKKIKFLIKKKTIKDIVGIISQEKNISKSEIYNYCLHIKNEK